MSNTIKDSLTTKKIDTINSNIEYFVDVINNNLKHLISIDSRDYLYIKINAILFVADKNSQFYNDGLFLKKYVKRIFELINPKYSNIKLTRVFESIEIKEKFYVLLKDYLYENWNTKIEQIISISPSESYIKNKQQSEQKLKFKEEEQKRKKLKAKFNDSKKIDNIKQGLTLKEESVLSEGITGGNNDNLKITIQNNPITMEDFHKLIGL